MVGSTTRQNSVSPVEKSSLRSCLDYVNCIWLFALRRRIINGARPYRKVVSKETKEQ
jgi:hypothetical protein